MHCAVPNNILLESYYGDWGEKKIYILAFSREYLFDCHENSLRKLQKIWQMFATVDFTERIFHKQGKEPFVRIFIDFAICFC